jgi:AsmA-like C-terminal region
MGQERRAADFLHHSHGHELSLSFRPFFRTIPPLSTAGGRFKLIPLWNMGTCMSWRKWVVRSLVFSIVLGIAGAAFLYYRWTNSANVKREVLNFLSSHFPGAEVSLDSAYLRLLGEISLNEIHIFDRQGRTEFAYVPSALVYHDKERLNDGVVAIRKVILERPRLRFVRLSDGSWNVAHILGPTSDEPMPILVIKGGTVVVEDHTAAPLKSEQAGASCTPVEIKAVDLVVVHEARGPVTFEGKGQCPLGGPVQIKGSWQPGSSECVCSFQANAVPLNPSFIRRMAAYWPEAAEYAEQLEGVASLQADLSYRPRNSPSWTHNLHWQLSRGTFRHSQLPVVLEKIEAKGHCVAGRVTLEHLTAEAGSAHIKMNGMAKGLTADSDFTGNISIENLLITPEMLGRLGDKGQKLKIDYTPRGLLDLTCHWERISGKNRRHAEIRLNDISGEYAKFRYPVEHLSGPIVADLDTSRSPAIDNLTLNLVGWASGQKVYIKGQINGDGPDSAVAVRIWGDNIPLDAKLQAALDQPHQKLAQSFHPTGLANFDVDIRRAARSRRFNNRYVIHFHDTSARYDVFRYPVENVEGDLDVQEDSWEFRNFSGTHKGCRVQTWGRSEMTAEGRKLVVHIQGQGLPLDAELESALEQPELKEAWQSFHPQGKIDFTAQVTGIAQFVPEVVVSVTPIDCSVQPNMFPYLLSHLTGKLQYENRKVHLEKLRAVHGGTVMNLDEIDVFLKPEGGVYARLKNLQGTPLLVTEDLKRAMPEALRNICQSTGLEGPVRLKVDDLRIDTSADNKKPAVVYWDGELGLTDAGLYAGIPMEHVTGKIACRGRCEGDELRADAGHSPLVGNLLIQEATILKQPFRNIHCALEVPEKQNQTLLLRGIHGTIFGGEVYGETRVDLGPNPAYEVNLTGSQIRLEDFARHNLKPGIKMTGAAAARLYLTGRGHDLSTISGNGSIDVPKGRMYELNLLLDLLKILNLRVPDGTAFDEAHAAFTIRGNRVTINRLDLLGTPVSLGGKGQMNLDGSDLHLEFYAVWARVMQVLPPIINEIPKSISQQILKIKLQGNLGVQVQTTKEPVPILVEPLKEFLELMRGKGRSQESAVRNQESGIKK